MIDQSALPDLGARFFVLDALVAMPRAAGAVLQA